MPARVGDVIPSSVLLVRHDATWLHAASDALRAAGFETLSATSGADALHHVNNGFHPAVIATAVQMAGIGGLELARAIRDVSPASAVVLMAHSVLHPRELAQLAPAVMLVEPFQLDDLVSSVRDAVHTGTVAQDQPPPDVAGAFAWSFIVAVTLTFLGWFVAKLVVF